MIDARELCDIVATHRLMSDIFHSGSLSAFMALRLYGAQCELQCYS